MQRWVSSLVFAACIPFAGTVAVEAQDERAREEIGQGFFFDVAVGWTALRGNDVYVGDRTTISQEGLFDDSTLMRLVTEMGADTLPRLRVGFRGETWGIEGELWRLSTGGSLADAFAQADVQPRSEMVNIWNAWQGENDDEVSYAAQNDISLLSARIDVTRSLTRALSLSVGAHIAKLENEREEQVELFNQPYPFDPFDLFLSGQPFSTTETREGRARMSGWLAGPSVGLRGSTYLGENARVGYAFSQSFLFSNIEQDATWSRASNAFLGPSDVSLDTSFSFRASVPVSDLRATLSFDLGEHFSFGVLGLVSVWYDVPTALEFDPISEKWDEVNKTLVFASIGPVLKFRF